MLLENQMVIPNGLLKILALLIRDNHSEVLKLDQQNLKEIHRSV